MTSRILRWTERALLGFALALLAYAGFTMADSWMFQRQAHRNLERLISHETAAAVQTGGLIGRIDVERLAVSVVLLEGSDERVLARAAGHIAGTALPGEAGNVGIAGHRDTFFRPLRNIRPNDVIRVTTPRGEFRYRVVSTRVVAPGQVSVLDSDGSDSLTLVTCYPFYFVGSAPHRFVVRAERFATDTGIPAS
jgi:sortase A